MEYHYYQVGDDYTIFFKNFKTIKEAKEFAQILANSKRGKVYVFECLKRTTTLCQVNPNLETK
jgi:hypothetical protein